MNVTISRNALDRVPLSLIIDDSTVLLNLNYFWMRDRNPVDGQNRRWEDVPVVHPEWFTRDFAEWCAEQGVKGKFSVVPCPAAVGRIDEGLPLFSREQQESWLRMCRELIMPNFDITPEMITHSVVVDPDTFKPMEPRIWEQYEWARLPENEDAVTNYIAAACQILDNVGLTPTGVTSPGGFGGQTLPFYAKCSGEAVRSVSGNPTPFFFKRINTEGPVDTPVWYGDPESGTAVGEIIASTADRTGSWTGYGEVDPDAYIGPDLESGRLPELIRMRQPAVLCSHWQGFYGMHSDDQRGFTALRTIVARLKALDPRGEWTRWRTCSAITNYACMRDMADIAQKDNRLSLHLPVIAPELTLEFAQTEAKTVTVNEKPLRKVASRPAFQSGTFLVEEGRTLAAFDPDTTHPTVAIVSDA